MLKKISRYLFIWIYVCFLIISVSCGSREKPDAARGESSREMQAQAKETSESEDMEYRESNEAEEKKYPAEPLLGENQFPGVQAGAEKDGDLILHRPVPTPKSRPESLIQPEKKLKLKEGQYVFNPPGTMKCKKSYGVEFRICRDPDLDLTSGLRGTGEPETGRLVVTRKMRARLTGGEWFKIFARSSETQRVTETGYTHWEWDVVPQKSGKHILYLSVSAFYKDEVNEWGEKCYESLKREIDVKVNPRHTIEKIFNFLKEQIVKIVVSILTAFLIAYLGIKRKKSRKKN